MSPLDRRPAVSIVAPCYNEAEVLPLFYERAAAAARSVAGDDHEIVLVDDGSRDETWDVIARLARQDANVVGVRLMRNHGHQGAVSAGLALCRGRRVMLIDADLQDPPELLGQMMARMDEGADVVFGQRISRESETMFKRATASIFYRVLNRLAAVDIPRDTGDFRLMTRRVVEVLGAMPERQRFIRGMVSWIGGRQVALPYRREARAAGVSKYPFTKMVRFAADAITSFSSTPLRLATYVGFATVCASLLLLVYTVYRWFMGDTVVGWSSVMTAIVMFSAVQLIVLGILGEYVGRLFQEAKGRPNFLVDVVLSDEQAHQIPVEFCNLTPAMRRDVWDAIRNVHVAETGV